MKKIKKLFLYCIGYILSFGYGNTNLFAQGVEPWYGTATGDLYPAVEEVQVVSNKPLHFIFLTPFILVVVGIILIVGAVIFFYRNNFNNGGYNSYPKEKQKNDKKDF